MKTLFQPNIGKTGRLLRAGIGLVLLALAAVAWRWHEVAGAGLVAAGVFCLFEAARGWCIARACGLKTKW
jgi:hypothetical protein